MGNKVRAFYSKVCMVLDFKNYGKKFILFSFKENGNYLENNNPAKFCYVISP